MCVCRKSIIKTISFMINFIKHLLHLKIHNIFLHREVKIHYIFKMVEKGQVWWYMPAIPALRRQRQEDCECKVSLCYIETLSQKKGGRDIAQ
jgi:hypothetical protein